MQALVYIFIGIAAVCVGAAGYFGLAFTPIDAMLAALAFAAIANGVLERTLRLRAQARLEKAIGDLSRLLSTDAQAGAALSQRVARLTEEKAGARLDAVEADISVLGTVIRQVAEAVAELEQARARPAPEAAPSAVAPVRTIEPEPREAASPIIVDGQDEPAIPLAEVKQALAENRLVFHVQPVVMLPQRRPVSYDLVARLMLEEGGLVDAEDVLPRRGGEAVRRQIEGIAFVEAVTLGRRARSSGAPVTLNIPVGPATLEDEASARQLCVTVEANRGLVDHLVLKMDESAWRNLSPGGRMALDRLRRLGMSLALTAMPTLRVDAADLSARGVNAVRVPASTFIAAPEIFTDLHSADIVGWLRRFDIDLVAIGITGEREILELLDIGVSYAQGPHIGAPMPADPPLMSARMRDLPPRRAELS